MFYSSCFKRRLDPLLQGGQLFAAIHIPERLWGEAEVRLQLKPHLFLAAPLPSPVSLTSLQIPPDSTLPRYHLYENSICLQRTWPKRGGLTDTCQGEKAELGKTNHTLARPWQLKERELIPQSFSANDHCPQGAQPKPPLKELMKRQDRKCYFTSQTGNLRYWFTFLIFFCCTAQLVGS